MCVLHVKACGMQLGCMCNFVTFLYKTKMNISAKGN